MLFNPLKNLVTFFKKSERGMTKSTNTSSQFCKPLIGLCALLCMSLWISAAQAQTPQQMRTNLAVADLIPASSLDAGYTDSEEITATVGVSGEILDPDVYASFNDTDRAVDSAVGLVDWVEVQIRVVANTVTEPPATRPDDDAGDVYIKAAWLLSDGSVVDVDSDIATINSDSDTEGELTIPTGDEGLEFDAATQNLYVLITHRNHLPIMSASDVTANTDSVYEYDFTTGTDQAVGGVSALKEAGGVLSMIVADTGRDGNVGGADISSDIRPNIGNATYHVGDVTLDANVGGSDVAQAQANIGAATQITY